MSQTTRQKNLTRLLTLVFVCFILFINFAFTTQSRAETYVSSQWIMGYYAGWELQKFPVSEIDWNNLTHVAVAFYLVSPNGTIDSSLYQGQTNGPILAHSIVDTAHAKNKKAIASFGGAGSGAGFEGATSSANRAAFVQAIKNVVTTYNYDGVDIDWEPITVSDRPLLTALITDLRAAMPGTLITLTAAPRNNNVPEDITYIANMSSKLDQVNVMTYEMSGAWEGWKSWHASPLFWNNNSTTPTGIDNTVNGFLAAGIPASKLGIGSGFYGLCYTSPVTAPVQALNGSSIPENGKLHYINIISNFYTASTYHWDNTAKVPYLSFASPKGVENCTYITYENEQSIAEKAAYLKSKSLGGVIVWTMGEGYMSASPAGQRHPLMKPMSAIIAAPGDLNLDHIVNSLDWSAMNGAWFAVDKSSDLNFDGIVNGIDYSILNNNWFKTW